MEKVIAGDQEREVVAAYESGATIRQIAAERGVSPAAVHGALRRQETVMRPTGGVTSLTPAQDDEVETAYVAGESMDSIAARLGVKRPSVRSALDRRGVERRPGGGRIRAFTPEQEATVVRMYREDGLSQSGIAQELGTSQPRISRLLRSKGIQTETRRYGRGHGAWKGGRIPASQGYMQVLGDRSDSIEGPMCNNAGYILEHRLVMARHLGRPLVPTETVHHKNGKRDDNRIDNLEIRSGKHGKGQKFCCGDCGSHNIIAAELG